MTLAHRLQAVVGWTMVTLVLAPVILVVWMSFTPTMLLQPPLRDFSLRWYEAVFDSSGFLDAAWLSARLALSAAALAVAASFLAVYGMARFRPPGARGLLHLFTAPLVVPAVVFGIAALQFANRLGLYGSFAALLLAHVVLATPFAVRALGPALADAPAELEWAAMSLGAPRWRAILAITLPLMSRGLVASFLLCFLVSFSEVTVTLFMTGPQHQTLPVRIFNYVSDRIDPTVAAVSSLVILATVLLVLVLDRLGGFRSMGARRG